MPSSMPRARCAGKTAPPTSSAKPSAIVLPSTLHLAAHRLASNLGVPFGVALAHAEAAGLGRAIEEVRR